MISRKIWAVLRLLPYVKKSRDWSMATSASFSFVKSPWFMMKNVARSASKLCLFQPFQHFFLFHFLNGDWWSLFWNFLDRNFTKWWQRLFLACSLFTSMLDDRSSISFEISSKFIQFGLTFVLHAKFIYEVDHWRFLEKRPKIFKKAKIT